VSGEEVTIELSGLAAFGPHGVTEAERAVGCRIELDIALTVAGCSATETDELDGTVDYGAVASLATELVRERSFHTLERLGAVIAEEILASFDVARVVLRIAKPAPPIPDEIEDVAVTITRERG
jgi:dihydroneopterin aldolase